MRVPGCEQKAEEAYQGAAPQAQTKAVAPGYGIGMFFADNIPECLPGGGCDTRLQYRKKLRGWMRSSPVTPPASSISIPPTMRLISLQ